VAVVAGLGGGVNPHGGGERLGGFRHRWWPGRSWSMAMGSLAGTTRRLPRPARPAGRPIAGARQQGANRVRGDRQRDAPWGAWARRWRVPPWPVQLDGLAVGRFVLGVVPHALSAAGRRRTRRRPLRRAEQPRAAAWTSEPGCCTVGCDIRPRNRDCQAQVDGRSIDLTPDLAGEPGSRPCVANIRR